MLVACMCASPVGGTMYLANQGTASHTRVIFINAASWSGQYFFTTFYFYLNSDHFGNNSRDVPSSSSLSACSPYSHPLYITSASVGCLVYIFSASTSSWNSLGSFFNLHLSVQLIAGSFFPEGRSSLGVMEVAGVQTLTSDHIPEDVPLCRFPQHFSLSVLHLQADERWDLCWTQTMERKLLFGKNHLVGVENLLSLLSGLSHLSMSTLMSLLTHGCLGLQDPTL